MASIRREIALEAPAEHVWDSVRDFGAVHKRVAPGFVVECALEGDTRVVTFSNGTVGRMPANVSLSDLAIVRTGFAKKAAEVSQSPPAAGPSAMLE